MWDLSPLLLLRLSNALCRKPRIILHLPVGPADLADGAVCDVRVCRHPVGVSCDHRPSADHLQGERRLG